MTNTGDNEITIRAGDRPMVEVEVGVPGPQGPPGTPGAPGPAGPGVATGGDTGEILAKASPANYDTEWIPPPEGGGGGAAGGYVRLTSSGQTWTVPQGVTTCRVRTRDGGAGGGGSSNAAAGGGAAGVVIDVQLSVTAGQILHAVIAAGAPGGTAGVVGTTAGGNGGNSAQTLVRDGSGSGPILVGGPSIVSARSQGGLGGVASGSSTTVTGGVSYGNWATWAVGGVALPGSGGIGGGQFRLTAPMLCVVGGAGATGGWVATVFETYGGPAQQAGQPLGQNMDTNTGVREGMTATEPGCGGGGAGAVGNASAGSAGFVGGAGAPGLVEIWW